MGFAGGAGGHRGSCRRHRSDGEVACGGPAAEEGLGGQSVGHGVAGGRVPLGLGWRGGQEEGRSGGLFGATPALDREADLWLAGTVFGG